MTNYLIYVIVHNPHYYCNVKNLAVNKQLITFLFHLLTIFPIFQSPYGYTTVGFLQHIIFYLHLKPIVTSKRFLWHEILAWGDKAQKNKKTAPRMAIVGRSLFFGPHHPPPTP